MTIPKPTTRVNNSTETAGIDEGDELNEEFAVGVAKAQEKQLLVQTVGHDEKPSTAYEIVLGDFSFKALFEANGFNEREAKRFLAVAHKEWERYRKKTTQVKETQARRGVS